jgi:hypothetical protein
MFAPLGDRSISTAVDCFVPDLVGVLTVALDVFSEFRRLRSVRVDFVAFRFFTAFAIGISVRFGAAIRPHRRSPAVAVRPAGLDPESALRARSDDSTALLAVQCQPILDTNVALLTQFGAFDDPWHRSNATSERVVMSGAGYPRNSLKPGIYRCVRPRLFTSVHGVSVVILWSQKRWPERFKSSS